MAPRRDLVAVVTATVMAKVHGQGHGRNCSSMPTIWPFAIVTQ
jgi:hypothetical protein